MKPDYSIYLVTDSAIVPETCDFLTQVEQAVGNGATVVQLREKNLPTVDFVQQGQKVLAITRSAGIPLIVNDRIDVALAIGADGVHVGQDDMPASTARRLIGPNMILGVSCSSEAETAQVCAEGVADYVGLGTLFPTKTKDTNTVCGPLGIRRSLEVLKGHNENAGKKISCVAIGGINSGNVSKVMHQCCVVGQKLDGVAVVSCIMAAPDSAQATKVLVEAFHKPYGPLSRGGSFPSSWNQAPMVHHITNNVVKNFCANVTLATGGSPIMSELPEEFGEFASLSMPVCLVVNLGTPSSALLEVMQAGVDAYNKQAKPVLFDPVAAGASRARLAACRRLLNAGQFTVIKGNLGEIMALESLTRSEVQAESSGSSTMQGVDSIAQLSEDEIVHVATRVAREFRTVVVVTGAMNYVVSGDLEAGAGAGSPRWAKVPGGHHLMGSITGMGCALGSSVGCYVAYAVYTGCDVWAAVHEALKRYNVAGSISSPPGAAKSTLGPGTFSTLFLDNLYKGRSIVEQ